MVRSRQKWLVAATLGVLLAGAPIVGFDVWIEQLIDRQSDDDIARTARRTVAVVDSRLAETVEGLESLAAQSVAACTPADVEKLRRAVFATSPAKEFSVIGPDGQTRCTDMGSSPGARKIMSMPRAAIAGEVVTEVIRLGDSGKDYLRVRRFNMGGGSVAALVPADMLVPLASTRTGPFTANARLFTRDGLLIGEGGKPLPTDAKPTDLVSTTIRSERFGITVTMTSAKEAVEPGDLRMIGRIVNGVVAVGLLGVAWLFWRRRGADAVGAIRRALDRRQMVPYFQPIIDIGTGKLIGAEVLARWRKRNGTVVLPAAFMPLVEQSGLMVELTESLMRQTCGTLGEAYAKRPHLKIAFNLTARHFADDTVVTDLREIFDRAPIKLSQVTLELTEREPIEDLTMTARVIAALQGLGCQVALDDVGTGHSGLSSILKLGVNIIKIDKIFIDSLGTDRNSATIVATMVELARNMKMEVVAEGVESFEQVADLRGRGIRAAQGYVFAPPLPGPAFLTLLESLDPLVAERPAQAQVQVQAA